MISVPYVNLVHTSRMKIKVMLCPCSNGSLISLSWIGSCSAPTLIQSQKRRARKEGIMFLMKRNVGKSHLFAFMGAILLMRIHNVRNHRKAWSSSEAQVLLHLRDLLTCQLFELIRMFIHLVTPEERQLQRQSTEEASTSA